jgi:isocitrate dehydrogenase
MNDSSASAASASVKTDICVARGDGIGPEIMDATLRILQEAGAVLDITEIGIGLSVYEEGISSGVSPDAWDKIREHQVLLKAPITTPQGGGVKSLNVTLRKTFGLYANIRPCRSYAPFVHTHHPEMDLVIVRENEEDTYAGIEHQQTREVTQCLKLITRPGCEKIIRHAFAFTKQQGRKKLTCMTKDNIMKHTDGLFHQVFNEVAAEYPEIETEHMIIDIGSARLATRPGSFDVIVAPNLYGDIISDIAADVAGSVGLAGSANLGRQVSMFEAIHGSAPDIAGQNIANPSALLRGACMMLVHLGQREVAEKVENAWLKTIEDGMHTADIYTEKSVEKLGTREFAQAVIDRLGQEPETFDPVHYPETEGLDLKDTASEAGAAMARSVKTMDGVDFFLDWTGENKDPSVLGPALEGAVCEPFKLKMITNRGVKVYPDGHPETFCTDHWRCRFVAADGSSVSLKQIAGLHVALVEAGFDVIKSENLCRFDGERAYSLGQGE